MRRDNETITDRDICCALIRDLLTVFGRRLPGVASKWARGRGLDVAVLTQKCGVVPAELRVSEIIESDEGGPPCQ